MIEVKVWCEKFGDVRVLDREPEDAVRLTDAVPPLVRRLCPDLGRGLSSEAFNDRVMDDRGRDLVFFPHGFHERAGITRATWLVWICIATCVPRNDRCL